MNSAVIVAGGTGKRFGGDVPKQFLEVCGRPLILHTVGAFDRCPEVGEIIVVLPADYVGIFGDELRDGGFGKLSAVVAGGATRAESVARGIAAVSPDCRIVAIHDGARPLVSGDEIGRTIAKAAEVGAACLTAPVTDTIKIVRDGLIERTVDRTSLRRALTPQAFRIAIIRAALEASDLSETVTDECLLVERTGQPIAVVEGSARNIKITTPEDLEIAASWIGRDHD
jgi:2-C-methyl-D-erythritol 4-phosphate cytidylyltransferase